MNNNIISRSLTTLFTCAMTGAMLIPAFAVSADTKIAINEKNFPDKNFRKELKKDGYDIDQDGYLSSDEIKQLTDFDVNGCKIKDLTGIELLTDLEALCCDDNELTTIDLSKNTKLWNLRCQGNLLKTLDLSKNTNLSYLSIDNNMIDNLDLSKNTELSELICRENLLKTLDLSKNTKLKTLWIDNNKLEKLDLSKNTELTDLQCKGNLLKTLDLPKSTKLEYLWIDNNKLENLDLSKNTGLKNFRCEGNLLKTLDLSKNTNLDFLNVANNKFDMLDISKNPGLSDLYCQGNQIDKLDISGCYCLVDAFAGDKVQENGYVVYNSTSCGYSFAVDDKTFVISAHCTIDDNTRSMFLDIGAVVSLGFKETDNQTKVTMTSSDDSIVKIGSNNMLITNKAGSSDITAKVDDKEYTFKVTVYYKDVRDNKYFWFEPTYALTEKGVVKGYDNQTRFKPDNKCTRAQMVTFIWRLAGSPEPTTKECKFSDVKKSDYFYKACLWGNENHIVEGYKDGTFGPQIVCARRHAVTFLWRLAGKPEPNVDKIKFTDVFKDINEDDYFYEACLWASEKKIVAGYDDNTFRPNGDCLRRQMVTFLYKYDKFVINK